MGKNVAVFVDVANIFYAAKAAGVDIDYVTLLKASSAGRDLVRAYAYTGLDPDNENQRNFHDFLRRHGYRVVSKDIRKYGDGKVKANLDIELVVDMMKTARNLDVAIVVSGDGDFAPAIRAVQEQGVRVEVVSFRGNTSSDLMDVADLFTDITQIAKVEKGSSRSGRRVADDDMDLSMTEVPDKQSEGTGDRSRGRGRTRRTTTTVGTTATRGRARPAAPVETGDGVLVALPGEKLSRAAAMAAPRGDDDFEELDGESADLEGADGEVGDGADGMSEDGLRRRRRRGGRGRGRGRGREDGMDAPADAAAPRVAASADRDLDEDDAEEEEAPPAPSRRAASTFGSVWDSQIGVAPSTRSALSSRSTTPAPIDDEDLDEPAVPEYLLTERRQRDAGRGGQRGGRGRGGAYAAALDRERFGGGRGSTPSRYAEPPRGRDSGFGRGGDPVRGSDRGGDRDRGSRGGDRDRGFRDQVRPAPRPSGDEPWSEVPPEIEAMLRAQMGSRPAAARPARPAPAQPEARADAPVDQAAAPAARRPRTRRPAPEASADAPAAEVTADEPAPKAPARRSRATAAKSADVDETAAKPARRASTRKAATVTADADATAEMVADAPAPAAPKRRAVRKKAEPAD